jgi:hypothetical protein
MKPFNLEKALAGEPVVTRDGRPVKIAGYNPDAEETHRVMGWINGCPFSWGADGYYNPSKQPCSLDLFMAEKPKVKKEGWVNVYRTPQWIISTSSDVHADSGHVYKDKETAIENGGKFGTYIDTAKIEWEEEA